MTLRHGILSLAIIGVTNTWALAQSVVGEDHFSAGEKSHSGIWIQLGPNYDRTSPRTWVWQPKHFKLRDVRKYGRVFMEERPGATFTPASPETIKDPKKKKNYELYAKQERDVLSDYLRRSTPATEDKVNHAYGFYRKKGLSEVGAAYLVGSLVRESGLDPEAKNGPGRGLGQWTDDEKHHSWKEYKEKFREKKIAEKKQKEPEKPWTAEDELDAQLDYAIQWKVNITNELKDENLTRKRAAQLLQDMLRPAIPGDRTELSEIILNNVQTGKPAGSGFATSSAPSP